MLRKGKPMGKRSNRKGIIKDKAKVVGKCLICKKDILAMELVTPTKDRPSVIRVKSPIDETKIVLVHAYHRGIQREDEL